MSTFILVHGGWHGAWCWDRVAPLVRAAGHTVIAPDLPAHGRDTTPLSARPYERYVPSICDLLRAQSDPAILVGHSSGGAIISDVAAQEPDSVRALVYLAAFLLPRGVSPPAIMRNDIESLLSASLVIDGQQSVRVKPERARDVFYGDCSDEDAAGAIARLQPEPLIPRDNTPPATVETAITTRTPVPRIYIETLHDKALGPQTQKRMYTAMPCERIYSLPTDHSPFLSAPAALAAILTEIGDQFAPDIASRPPPSHPSCTLSVDFDRKPIPRALR